MSGVSDQPMPTGDGPIVWKEVDRDIRQRINDAQENAASEETLKDIKDRVDFGKSKYNTVLRAFNGRDPLQDSLEEIYDHLLYLKQKQMEERVDAILRRLVSPERVLVTGATGYVGGVVKDFIRYYTKNSSKDIQRNCCGSRALDVTDGDSIKRVFDTFEPTIVFHLASKADTDWCEKSEANYKRAYEVNVDGTKRVVEKALDVGADVVYFSSGCLYPNNQKYYTEEGKTSFKCNYTKTKYMAELTLENEGYLDQILNVRLRQPFSNFVHDRDLVSKILGYHRLIDEPNSMTHLEQAIVVIWELVMRGVKGTYNICNKGAISPYEIAVRHGLRRDIEKITYRELLKNEVDAVRVNSLVDCSKLREETGISLSCIHPAIHFAMNTKWDLFIPGDHFDWLSIYPLIEGQLFTKELLLD